jgi:biotin-dependent carboxylase-like uncharacterized protein
MKIEIVDKGLFSLIVDNGRVGRQRDGFSQSGPMDEDAFSWANFLAFNLDNTPCIEAMGTLTARFSSHCIIAVTGRAVKVTINGHEQPSYESICVTAGDEVTFGSEYMGSKAYLAICGSWDTPLFANSACTVTRESLGGLHGNGSALANGDSFNVNENTLSKVKSATVRTLAFEKRFNYSLEAPIRLIPGYQFEQFSGVAQRIFVTSDYTVTSSIDRMGYRLQGPDVACSHNKLRSEAVHIGAVQVPPDGQPIVMMRDRQTLGGYPKLGCVNPLDINRLAQAVPGEKVSFTYQNHETARADNLLSLCRRRQLQGELL